MDDLLTQMECLPAYCRAIFLNLTAPSAATGLGIQAKTAAGLAHKAVDNATTHQLRFIRSEIREMAKVDTGAGNDNDAD